MLIVKVDVYTDFFFYFFPIVQMRFLLTAHHVDYRACPDSSLI